MYVANIFVTLALIFWLYGTFLSIEEFFFDDSFCLWIQSAETL